MELIRGDEGKRLAESLLQRYFQTQSYPFTRHHIDSYDQFLAQDLPAMIAAENPFLILHDQIGDTGVYAYRAEIFIGGMSGSDIFIGAPTVHSRERGDVRILFPNEARLRNMTYASIVQANIVIRLTFSRPSPTGPPTSEVVLMDPVAEPTKYAYLAKYPLFRIPILLHSRYCVLHNKPRTFLKEVGECPNDYGGYFIVDGSEKVLITLQEQAFNTLYIREQERDPKFNLYANISCLNPKTRQVKIVAFYVHYQTGAIYVSLPFVRKEIPLFTVFRALGVQSDEDILRLIFPDADAPETKMMEPLLHESILEGHPFYDTYSAVQYIKVFTKGFSEAHVLDILYNQTFVHVERSGGAKVAFLAECVRKLLRVRLGIDPPTDRDDIRNQRCLTSGILTRMMFQGIYKKWKKATTLTIDREYHTHMDIYSGSNYANLFLQGNMATNFQQGMLTEQLMKSFKGKWGSGLGEEKQGVLQALSRLSYLDFVSHCRRVVLNFDTGMKLASPRRLHTSQFGYYCTNETPGGASIGISKNLAILSTFSTFTDPGAFTRWLYSRGGVIPCDQITRETMSIATPVFVNAGILGYTLRPQKLQRVCRLMKWTGWLPPSVSVAFSISERRLQIFLDEGRPLRPLIHLEDGALPRAKLESLTTWRDLLLGTHPGRTAIGISSTQFADPLSEREAPTLDEYETELAPHTGCIEYIDPYEGNECLIACFPENIVRETTHMEIHPSSVAGILVSMIPFANHNQSPRNQLSASQSKQSVSVFATNYRNRFDNMAHVLCYGEAPLSRTVYTDYLGNGEMPYGHNLVLALGTYAGYNQEDGIVMNADAFQRGLFRNLTYRSYDVYEEDDLEADTKTRIGNPARIPGWTSLRPGLDYSKLDDRGIIRVGEYVDENTVLVGRYTQSRNGDMRDASVTAQVWTTGRVEKIAIVTNNMENAVVKVRVIQDRTPELGDKFSNRHGQKGTLGMMIRGHDMPRTASGLVPDMIMNPHAIPSRMTMAQMIEAVMGAAAVRLGGIANATMFMNDGNPVEQITAILRDQLGMNPLGEELLYDGTTGCMIPSTIFIGNVYTMRLKHMTEDKWNARGAGRREQRTHQPTGGRGNQGGLKIGEMDRDAIVAHGVSGFLRDSFMERSDGATFYVCDGCGTIPLYDGKGMFICPLCDGPIQYSGETAENLQALPPVKRTNTTFSKIAMPYSVKVLDQELSTYLNIGIRYATAKGMTTFREPNLMELTEAERSEALSKPLPMRVLPEMSAPEIFEAPPAAPEMGEAEAAALGLPSGEATVVDEGEAAEAAEAAAAAAAAVPLEAPVAPAPAAPAAQAAPVFQTLSFAQVPLSAPAAAPIAASESDLVEVNPDEIPDTTPAQQQQQPLQTQTVMPVMMMPVLTQQQPQQVLPPPVPGAPQTLVVDTSPQTMANSFPAAAPQSGGRRRSPSRSPSRPRAPTQHMEPSSSTPASVKVTIQKLG